MTEPVTTYRSLIVPNTGDLAGAWGTSALNPNFQMIDTMFGGVTTISLAAATTLALTVPATTGVWPGGSPSQSSNSLIKFSGTLTGNAVVQFTLPGYYIIHNLCSVGGFYIQLANVSGSGNKIGAPPGQKIHVFFDGTDMDYVNQPPVGSAIDLHGWTALPAWMTACTVSPYLIKDGATALYSTFPALANMLGSTFGGNGITTFGLPDERARARLALDTVQAASGATSARLTFGIAGFTGSLMGSAGGDQRMQTHTHGITDPSHVHGGTGFGGSPVPEGSGPYYAQNATVNGTTASATTGITINASGTGSSGNVPPSIVSFLPLIKT